MTKHRLKLIIPLLLFIVIVAFMLWVIQRMGEGRYQPDTLPSALLNQPLPTFEMPLLGDENTLIRHTDLLGQPALINIWATWCPSCYAEHGYLNRLKAQGMTVIGVNYKDHALAARQWLTQYGDPYRLNISDQYGKLGLDLGVTGAPETYVIDHRGFIRMRYQGPLDERIWEQYFAVLWVQLQAEWKGSQ